MMNHFQTNQRGFTLFTALLSFILILLAGLLVNTMINAERTSNEVILEVEAQSRMQSLADLTRADALQVVNYGIRNAIEEYSQNQGNAYPYSSQTLSWQSVQDDFSNFFFGQGNGSILAGRIAANLYVIVQSNPRKIGGYTITTKGGQEPEIRQAIQNVLSQTNSGAQNFLQVVSCDETTSPKDCVGTFYVNLDFSLLSDADFEKLPAIHVYDEATGRELVEPVIPRGKFRIYVPLRLFKALKYAHEIAQGQLAQGGGLLSPAFHSHLSELGVGTCDGVSATGEVICGYRTAPFTIASTQVGPTPPVTPITGGNFCAAESAGLSTLESKYPKTVPLVCDSVAASLGLCTLNATITSYNPAEAPSRAAALSRVVQDIINNHVVVSLNNIPQSPDFVLLTNQLDIQPSISSFATKDVLFEGIAGITNSEAKCSKLVNTNVTLRFEEKNLNYTVVDSRGPLHYDVRIVDSFVPQLTKTTCVSYCLQDHSVGGVLGTFIFGPNLSPDAATCPQTACAAPSKYNPLPSCGNGVMNAGAGEECDGTDFGPAFGDGVNMCSAYLNNPTASGNLSCGAAGSANECRIVTTACTIAPACGDGQITGNETCDPGINPETICSAQGKTCAPNGAPAACTCV